jgi:hypothetical protein
MARPNDVNNTSAPSSCARLGGVVEHSGDEHALVREQHEVVPLYSGVLE